MNETQQVGKITQLTTSPCGIRNWPNVQELQRDLAAANARADKAEAALDAVTKERDGLRDAVRKRDLAMSAHLKHCFDVEVKMDTVAKERDELLTRCGQIDGLKQRIAELNAMCDALFVENVSGEGRKPAPERNECLRK